VITPRPRGTARALFAPVSQTNSRWGETMRWKVLLIPSAAGIIVMAAPGPTLAQSQDQTPRFEAAAQFVGLHLNGTGEGAAGVGGRFGVNLTKYVSVEAETNYFPKNPSGNYGETLGLFGVKLTERFDRFGAFAKGRPGFIHFSGDLASRLSRRDQFALDIGGGFEFYPNRHTTLRFDIGDTIIPYGETTILLGPSPTTLGTRNNLQFEIGFAARF
jgi:hypothetical protein